ncbi:ATP-binding protein [Belliella kenyensis]|uniref:histidine kinase n=1 Tax=Belliella kenyensis TaxID=1472724 RepID=A0ABV8ELI3_9BACT|nr:sensor histidine kinase [Belliella kenyensis]MCH7403272.1 sensor histidine kinase [Belliella kenyensis]MDN3602913.1 sensor histidine kinase [Belliella kenyensis]
MFSNLIIIFFTFGYLALLFAIAWFSELKAKQGKRLSNHPAIYALTLAVYCTVWTYYGSVGRAATNGLEFLTIYIGPSLIAPLWWLIMRKIIRISKVQRISSIADFISSRYGKNITLGGVVTVVCLLGVLPYTSIQIKGVASSFEILQGASSIALLQVVPFYQDTAFYLAIGLALFTVLFGTRDIEATAQHEGMVMAVAFESIFKLLAFLVVGIFVSFFVFDGVVEIFDQAEKAGLSTLFQMKGDGSPTEWFWMSALSMMAILFLPRQFQMSVIENSNERHIDTAMWLFPLYLLLINLFVMPIALGGLVYFPSGSFEADTFVLAFPIAFDQKWLALLVFLGGFSAATGMIIVSTIALSTMVSNNLVMPALLLSKHFQARNQHQLGKILIWTRRLAIFGIILAAYLYYRHVAGQFTLVSIGLISFVAIAQFAPAIIGGIFWKRGARVGALAGIIGGFIIWFYTLVIPTMITTGYIDESLMTEGLLGIGWLKPHGLLGFEDLSYITHGLFFSLSINVMLYGTLSLLANQSSKEHNQAAVFVDIFKHSETMDDVVIWKGQAYLYDLKRLLSSFIGKERTDQVLEEFEKSTGKSLNQNEMVDPALVNYSERLLSGIIGAASARIMVSSVVKEEEITMDEVLGILKETQELKSLNNELNAKSQALKKATEELQDLNQTLRLNDMLKDEFISTVTHEMKTPITSIRAFSEILLEEEGSLSQDESRKFLDIIIQETNRMTRLIDQVLDLERFDSGKQELNLENVAVKSILMQAVNSIAQVIKEKGLKLTVAIELENIEMIMDQDRITQVILNLMSNASKFAQRDIYFQAKINQDQLIVTIKDDGKGIPEEEVPFIFDKFFQAKNQTSKKPIGSGLGLAICKKIITYHQGNIKVERLDGMTCFEFSIPIQFQQTQIKTNEQNSNSR